MGDKLVTVGHFFDSTQADIAKQILADFGIDAVLSGQNFSNLYSGYFTIAPVKLQVLESESKKALKIIGTKFEN